MTRFDCPYQFGGEQVRVVSMGIEKIACSGIPLTSGKSDETSYFCRYCIFYAQNNSQHPTPKNPEVAA